MKCRLKLLFIIGMLFLYSLYCSISTFSYNTLSAEILSKSLVPPFNDKSISVNSYGQAYYEYDFSLSSGKIDSLAKAVKSFGELRSSSQVVLSIIKTWTVSFNGKIIGIEVTYSLKGYMVVQVSTSSNVYGGASKVHFFLKFDGQPFTLEYKRLEQYGSGTKNYHYNLINKVKSFNLQKKVSKGERITIIASLITSAEAYGAIEDYSFANSDFYMGSFGAKLSVKIYYLEETVLTAKPSKNKLYLDDAVTITGKLTSSNGIPLANRKVNLYFDGEYVKSTYTMSDGSFVFSYHIPISTTPGTRTFTVKFNGDNSYLASQTSFSVLIPTFSIYTFTSSIKIPKGGSRSLRVHVYDVNGYDRNVKVIVKNAPSWLNIRFIGSNSNIPPFDVILVLKATDTGSTTIKIVGIGEDGQQRSIKLNVHAYNRPSFEIQVSPINQSVLQGGSAIFNVTIISLNGYSGNVYLNLTSPEIDIPYAFSVNPVRINDSVEVVKLSVYVPLSITPATYFFKVIGSDSTMQVESNTFSLHVNPLPQPSFKIDVLPKNQTIFAGDSASYSVILSSLNNFEGFIYLNITLPSDFNASFDVNPVYLCRGQSSTINLTITSNEASREGYYNFTIVGYSANDIKSDWIGLTVINYPAKIDFFYVNWISKKWFSENRFLPFEAVGAIVKYEPNRQIVIEFPKEIVSPYYKNIISLSTNSTGIATAIIPLKGPIVPFGSHTIVIRNSIGEIIGKEFIVIDGAKINYRVKNFYGYSIVYFDIKWASSNSSILNRNGTLQLELHLPDNSTIRTPPILGNGSIIFFPPRIDADIVALAYLLYTDTSQKVYENSSSSSVIQIRFRSIASYLIQKKCIDLSYNLKIKVYYRFTLEPANNITVKLLVLNSYGKILLSIEEETDDSGTVHFSLSLPFEEALIIKILCSDRNDEWITCSEWADLFISKEFLRVMITVSKNSSFLLVKLASLCGLMDLHCSLLVKIYDEAGRIQFTSTQPIFIRHGLPMSIIFPVDRLRAYRVYVRVDFRSSTIGEIFERVMEREW